MKNPHYELLKQQDLIAYVYKKKDKSNSPNKFYCQVRSYFRENRTYFKNESILGKCRSIYLPFQVRTYNAQYELIPC